MASNDVITKADIEGLKVYMDGRISGLEDRMTGVESRLSGIEDRITGVEARISGLEDKVSGIEVRLSGVEVRVAGVEQAVGEVRTDLRTEIRVNAAKIDGVRDSMNWGFATLAIAVAIVGFTITLAPMFREIFREKRKEKREDEIRNIFREEFAKLQGNP